MLATDAKKLRWCGIDMRSRLRRRVAVMVTYAGFLMVVWWHPGWIRNAVEIVWLAWFLSSMWFMVKETELSTRALFTALWALILGVQVWTWHGRADTEGGLYSVLFVAFLLVEFGSVLSPGKIVDGGGGGWLARAIEQGEKLNWRQQRRLARMGYAVGLDGFAWYEYTQRYKQLTTEQKAEIEEMQRANPHGRWMRGGERILFDDERLRQEDNTLRARVQRTMSWVLVLIAIGVSLTLAQGWTIRREEIAAGVWTLAMLMVTLRQAIVLWTEQDPRAVGGEIELVEREA